jgi:hypothetical protein
VCVCVCACVCVCVLACVLRAGVLACCCAGVLLEAAAPAPAAPAARPQRCCHPCIGTASLQAVAPALPDAQQRAWMADWRSPTAHKAYLAGELNATGGRCLACMFVPAECGRGECFRHTHMHACLAAAARGFANLPGATRTLATTPTRNRRCRDGGPRQPAAPALPRPTGRRLRAPPPPHHLNTGVGLWRPVGGACVSPRTQHTGVSWRR